MLQITIRQNGSKTVHVCSTDEKAQQFLEQVQKTHVKQYGLEKIESLKKQCYNKKQRRLNSDYRDRVQSECAEKVKKELESLPVKPSLLRVEIRNIGNLL